MELEGALVQGIASGGSMAAALLIYLDRRLLGIESGLNRLSDILASCKTDNKRPPS